MSNKTQLQTNNTELSSLIEVLRGKATGGSSGLEDVTEETETYTAKLNELTNAVTALENELNGKAGIGGASFETCTVCVYAFYLSEVTYTDETGTLKTIRVPSLGGDAETEITVVKNTLLYTVDSITDIGKYGTEMSVESSLLATNVAKIINTCKITIDE